MPEKDIIAILNGFNLDHYYEKHPDFCGDPSHLFLNLFNKDFKNSSNSKTFWFHATRVFPADHPFKDGVLPLQNIIEKIWKNIFSIAKTKISESEWIKFKEDLEKNYSNHFAMLYRLKLNDSIHGGPWAFLVKDLISKTREMGNHDYLRVPEIVEDICICFDEKYNENLQELVFQSTKPCIVKFIDNGLTPLNLGTVLYYLYSCFHKLDFNLYCNNIYDGKGVEVKSEAIYKVEYV